MLETHKSKKSSNYRSLKKINRFISVINKKEGASCITTHLHDAGLGNTEKVSVCDLWHQKDLGEYKGEFWAQVP